MEKHKQIEQMEQDLIDSVEHETLFDVDFYKTSENLINKGYRNQQDILEEISNLVYDLIRVIESESGMDIVQKSYYKASLILLLTKINERYGV